MIIMKHYGSNENFPIVLDFVIRNISWCNHWHNFWIVINCRIVIVIGTPMDLKVDCTKKSYHGYYINHIYQHIFASM
jgi:hypothetical protein